MGGDGVGQVDLGCINKIADQVRGSKPVSSLPPKYGFQFQPPSSCLAFSYYLVDYSINISEVSLVDSYAQFVT